MSSTDPKPNPDLADSDRLSGEAAGRPDSHVQHGSTDTDFDSATLMGTDAEAAGTEPLDPIEQKIGKYEVRARLGQGGMGAVYLAFDPLIEREVAVKVLTPELSTSTVAVHRFLGEARAIGRLNHPHVVSIYDIDQWNGRYYLVMELLGGGSVADEVERTGRLDWKLACRLIAEAARGLSAAHAVGMIHRDIKPENLMLTNDQSVKVVDFGLSKLLDAAHDPTSAVTTAGQLLGTPQYMSPEQFESAEVDARTDIYSLGGTLFRLLTARFPYHDCRSIMQVMSAHMMQPPPVPSQYITGLPAELDRIVARAMAKERGHRYATAAELADDLETLMAPGRHTAAPEAAHLSSGESSLATAVIVEPSKLQAAVLKDTLTRSGASEVQLVSDLAAARNCLNGSVPNLVITSMQLPDGRGIDLLRELSERAEFRDTALVLHSADSTLSELDSIGSASCLLLVPRKVPAGQMLGVVHAAGNSRVSEGPLAASVDPAAVRLQIVLETARIPDVLADLIREVGILDVEVTVDTGTIEPVSPPPSLVLVLRRSAATEGGAEFAAWSRSIPETGPMAVSVQHDRGRLVLRAVRKSGVVAICQRVLDASQLLCLLQACRV